MKTTLLRRITAFVLCLCMLPSLAFAFNSDGSPVTRSDFVMELDLYADGFPRDDAAHYEQWQAFLDRISLRGRVDTQNPWMPLNRVYFNGGLYLDEKLTIPFEYDSYITFRDLRSPALGGASVHFQMNNFFQFMLKGYYYMGLPTQYVALPIYPQAFVQLYQQYKEPLQTAFAGEGSREVDYNTLYELCQELNLIVQDDTNYRTYYLFTCLLLDLGLSDMLLDRLAYTEDWLDYLDPDAEGMTITVDGENETWVLGETTVFEKTVDGCTLILPDPEGYEYRFTCQEADGAVSAQVQILLDEEEYLGMTVEASGLPQEGETEAEGQLDVTFSGSGWYYEADSASFAFRYARTAEELPYATSLEVDWLHPETGLPAIGFKYRADSEQQPDTVLVERPYDNQDDFFNLNESFMAEYKERFLPTLALAAAPFVLEMPAGILSDVIAFADATGILAFLGIE